MKFTVVIIAFLWVLPVFSMQNSTDLFTDILCSQHNEDFTEITDCCMLPTVSTSRINTNEPAPEFVQYFRYEPSMQEKFVERVLRSVFTLKRKIGKLLVHSSVSQEISTRYMDARNTISKVVNDLIVTVNNILLSYYPSELILVINIESLQFEEQGHTEQQSQNHFQGDSHSNDHHSCLCDNASGDASVVISNEKKRKLRDEEETNESEHNSWISLLFVYMIGAYLALPKTSGRILAAAKSLVPHIGTRRRHRAVVANCAVTEDKLLADHDRNELVKRVNYSNPHQKPVTAVRRKAFSEKHMKDLLIHEMMTGKNRSIVISIPRPIGFRIVMEGQSAAMTVRSSQMNEDQLAEFADQVANGIRYLQMWQPLQVHQCPQNVMIRGDGHVEVEAYAELAMNNMNGTTGVPYWNTARITQYGQKKANCEILSLRQCMDTSTLPEAIQHEQIWEAVDAYCTSGSEVDEVVDESGCELELESDCVISEAKDSLERLERNKFQSILFAPIMDQWAPEQDSDDSSEEISYQNACTYEEPEEEEIDEESEEEIESAAESMLEMLRRKRNMRAAAY